jgi:hypothetical protein
VAVTVEVRVYPSGVQLVIKILKYYRDIKIKSSEQ